MPQSPFVRPDQAAAPPLAHAEEVLVGRGMAAPIAHRVAELFLAGRDHLAGNDVAADIDELESLLERLAEHVREVSGEQPTEQVALLTATRFLATAAFSHRIWHGDPNALIARMVEHLAERGADYSGALATLLASKKDAAHELLRCGLVAALLQRELVDPCRFLDADKIRTTTKGVPGGGNWNQHERDHTASLPDFWVGVDSERAMKSFVSMLGREPADSLGSFAIGLERCLDLRYSGKAGGLYPLLVPITELLCRRRRAEGRENDVLLTRCCWAYGRWALEALPDCLIDDRGPLRELALAELGRMRGWLRDSGGDGVQRLVEHEDYLHTALFFVARTDPTSLWDVLRRLLLALRDLNHRAVPLDLRSWDEAELEPLPRPWGWVPDHIARVLEFFLGRELERDPALGVLRGKLAQFCLDRLKTQKKAADGVAVTEDDLVEPDPLWRLGYLHAIRELLVNPGGRGHNLLAWSQRHDPSELVREEAKLAHAAIRRDHKLSPGVSPRRAVYAAVWWMKQAHVLSLGERPDPTGAQRTFRKEARRARELDEQLV